MSLRNLRPQQSLPVSSVLVSHIAHESTSPIDRWIALAEQIAICGRMLRSRLTERANSAGLREVEFSILWACEYGPASGIAQSELAAGLAVSPAHVSGLVEQLRRKGLLEARRAPADRRRQLWRLTPSGKATLESALNDRTNQAGRFDDQLSPADLQTLSGLLDQVIGTLREYRMSNRECRGMKEKAGQETSYSDIPCSILDIRQGAAP